jgi:hypothetical protein
MLPARDHGHGHDWSRWVICGQMFSARSGPVAHLLMDLNAIVGDRA